MRRILCHFGKFVYLNENVEVKIAEQSPTKVRLNISVDNISRSKATIDFGDEREDCPVWYADCLQSVNVTPHALNLSFEDLGGRSGTVPFQMTEKQSAGFFPSAVKWLGALPVASLAATTYLVGMVCPGLHSIFSSLTVTACRESSSAGGLAFRVTDTDPRFGSIEQEIAGGGLTGTVSAFFRSPPVKQATMEMLAGLVEPAEFAGSLALIVGGSRGLGELAAKLIATGGGRVLITWQSGKDEAEKVAEEIRAAGGACETFAYDARKSAAEQLAWLADAPTHAYYFATPAIFRQQSELFSRERLKEFMAIYVDGFWQLAHALRSRQPSLSIYYPSSISVTERPKGMTEYTMAKAAGEVLCADMNVSLSPLRTFVSRLPRLSTDQTASVTPVETASALETMLPIVREVQSWPGKVYVSAFNALRADKH
jgi:hypothetical protein